LVRTDDDILSVKGAAVTLLEGGVIGPDFENTAGQKELFL
jgi:hypothetical protein